MTRYRKSLSPRAASPDEFPPAPDGATTRRSFLRLAGFSFGAAALAGCSRGLDSKAIPLLVQPEECIPGRALWYATRCGGCPAGCGVLAKSRDGRPIKLEGNRSHPLNGGGLCAVGQAQVLGVYDSLRLKQPLRGGAPASWEEVDREVRTRLAGARRVRVLTGTVHGPTRRAAIERFCKRFADARHVMMDALSSSALLDAHAEAFGVRCLPRFRFDRADVVVSFDADFLGTWLSPAGFARDWQASRDPATRATTHLQVESRLSLTGSNADRRIAVAPHEIGPMLADLAAGKGEPARLLDRAAPGRGLVLCGTNDLQHQRLALAINAKRGAYGAALDLERPSFQRLGDDRALLELRRELEEGSVDALLVAGCDPVYDLPGGLPVEKAGLVVSFAEREDETAARAHFVCPDHHPLESWDDGEPVAGLLTVGQPLLHPLFGTRAFVESLAAFLGEDRPAFEAMRDAWRGRVFPRHAGSGFDRFWAQSVHDGFAEVAPGVTLPREPSIVPAGIPGRAVPDKGELAVVLYPKVGMPEGRHAHNAWLQELPDPVSKVTWDTYAALSPATADALGVTDGDVVKVEAGAETLDLPAFVQPGQNDRVVAIALGYGVKGTDRFANVGPDWIHARPTVPEGGRVGVRAAGLLGFRGDHLAYDAAVAKVTRAGRRHALASTQLHHSLEGRDLVRDVAPGAPAPEAPAHPPARLWPDDHAYEGHHWAMAIDLARCTGCSACVIGCQAENNVPTVGKDEVRRQREMHWIRIDRYYGDDGSVAHQPMLCQQCDHAPCESVCPVLATVHSTEGLNQQVYNRCVGTRYCANNCPYKVRRFNWFDYPREDRLQNMVLNPDITVRMRGVMEKCSFCVQRIQEAKSEAKREGRALRDGDVQPACVQSCPATAIVFGDRNDPESAVAKALGGPRTYRVLEELDTAPSIGYLARVRAAKETHHG